MASNTPKKWAARIIPLLPLLFLWCSGVAWSATSTQSTPPQISNNKVTAPIPSKPGLPITGPSAKVATSPQTTGSGLNGASCPLDLTTGPKGDIRDIRGPIHIPDPRLWFLYALGGILLLFLAWAAWKWFGRRQALGAKAAFEIAFEELEKAKALMMPEKAEVFSVMVSDTIRTYIEKRFHMRATRKTTHEFITQVAIDSASELGRHSEALQDFLLHCDLAKFARQTFSREQMKKMHQSAWRFVEATRPRSENEAEKSAMNASATAESGKKSVKGRSGFFKDRIKGVRFPKKESGNQGYQHTHQAAAAGGR
jgi:hypothetical protein